MIYTLFFLILLLAMLAYFRLAERFNIVDRPNKRSSHHRVTLRGGGVVFFLGAVLHALWYGVPYPWFLAGLSLLAVISFVDDVRSVPNRLRLAVHFAGMLLLLVAWQLIPGTPWWMLVLALVFCTGIVNAWNFMDGINGITGGYSLVVLGSLAYINARMVAFVDPAFLYTVMLSVLVFNLFNFRRRARCFAGDVGSVSIAFIILFVLGRLILQTGDLSYIALLSIYGVDSVLTIIHRLIRRENIFDAHRKHAYQLLANELKVPHIQVAGLYLLLQALLSAGYLLVPLTMRWTYLGLSLLLLSTGYILFIRKYFVLHVNK